MTQELSSDTKGKIHAANMALSAAWMALFTEGLHDEAYMIHKAQNWVHCVQYPDSFEQLNMSPDISVRS